MNSRDLLKKIVARFEGQTYSTLTVVERQVVDLLIGQNLLLDANDTLYGNTEGESLVQDPPDYLQDVRDLYIAFGHRVSLAPDLGNVRLKDLRYILIKEEVNELVNGLVHNDVVQVAGALGDILYVTFGGCLAFGIPIAEVWKAVQASNMAKLGPDGKLSYNAIGEVLKPEGWKPPDIASIIAACSNSGEPTNRYVDQDSDQT